MKTSNKIFLAAVMLMLAYLVGYDFTLKTEYDKGGYKSRSYGMTEVKLGKFNVINHRAGNMLGLHIEQGKTYGIWIDKYYKKRIKISQQGQTLNIDYVDKEVRQSGRYAGITIICPVITSVIANTYTPKSVENGFSDNGTIEISGFKQNEPLNVRSDTWIDVHLANNTLNQLNANFGLLPGSSPSLTIDNNNIIKTANLNLKGSSSINLYNPSIAQPNYHFGDSTTVTLSGSALKMVQPK